MFTYMDLKVEDANRTYMQQPGQERALKANIGGTTYTGVSESVGDGQAVNFIYDEKHHTWVSTESVETSKGKILEDNNAATHKRSLAAKIGL